MTIRRLATLGLLILALTTGNPLAPHHDRHGTYASSTYHPFAQATHQIESRITVTTQQICTPAGHGVILHILTSTALGQSQAVDLRYTARYTDVGTLRTPGVITGTILTWTPTPAQPTTIVSLSSGPCLHVFPIVFVHQAPPYLRWLPAVGRP